MHICLQMHRFRGWCNIPYEGTKAMYLDDQKHPNQLHASHFADHDLFKVMYRLLGYVILTGIFQSCHWLYGKKGRVEKKENA
jgi:hypothetical protein